MDREAFRCAETFIAVLLAIGVIPMRDGDLCWECQCHKRQGDTHCFGLKVLHVIGNSEMTSGGAVSAITAVLN